MKKHLCIALLICVALASSVVAQKIQKPTLTPTEATAAQQQIIQQGIRLHDQKQYDEAIKLYEQILKENPNNDLALYEMALSYYNKKDYAKATEAAYKLAQYKSKTGVMGYGIIANVLDDKGEPQEALKIYKKAIELLEDSPEFRRTTAELYYNMGVTHARQKQYKEAREAAKKAVQFNFQYPSPNYLLAEIYFGTKYKVPAMLAAARLVSLEQSSPRAKRATAIFLDGLKPAQKDAATGNINIFINTDAPKDEGDFTTFDLLLGTLTVVKSDADKSKTENEIFADAVDTFIALLDENKSVRSSYVGKTYVPFLVEMKKHGYSKTFAYLMLQQSGDKTAEKRLLDDSAQTQQFLDWAKNYQLQ